MGPAAAHLAAVRPAGALAGGPLGQPVREALQLFNIQGNTLPPLPRLLVATTAKIQEAARGVGGQARSGRLLAAEQILLRATSFSVGQQQILMDDEENGCSLLFYPSPFSAEDAQMWLDLLKSDRAIRWSHWSASRPSTAWVTDCDCPYSYRSPGAAQVAQRMPISLRALGRLLSSRVSGIPDMVAAPSAAFFYM